MASGIGTGDVLMPSAADAAVRPARPADATAIAAVQARAWRQAFGAVLAPEALEAEALAEAWRRAVAAAPSPRHMVLVATSGAVVVGFVALAPAPDPDLTGIVDEIVVLAVDPPHQRAGHGSRLLWAATAAMRGHGATGIVAWLPLPDAVLRNFLASAGMVADGARRTLAAADGGTVTQLRLTAALG
ncbi:MAG TPA: GNAT family N-acetyltransferase [Kineosporiaceae bacterium]|nr:GNAT family N-acetyltransferase [Kineosporiaceae bacterium]